MKLASKLKYLSIARHKAIHIDSKIIKRLYVTKNSKPTQDIAFNRAIPITRVIVYERPEKAIADRATSSFTAISKSLYINSINKFTIVTENRYN